MSAARRARARRAVRGGRGDGRRSLAGRIGRGLFWVLLAIAAVLALVPGETPGVMPSPPVAEGATAAEVAASVAAAEALVPEVREGAEKTILWAGEAGAPTPLSVVYVHGFSASRAELSPVPERVAQALGANLFLTRLAGHGRGGPALGRARASHWMLDMAEALAVGKALGERVLVIGTSTGAALAAISAVEPAGREGVAGYVLVSPNFGVQAAGASLLGLPFARTLVPLFLGEERSWAPRNAAHAAGWTTRYPTEALVPMYAVAETAYLTDYATARAPALVLLSDMDRIVDPAKAREVAGRWGAGGTVVALVPGPQDDPDAHVLAGDALSPGLTERAVAEILGWAEARGIAAGGEGEPAAPDGPGAPGGAAPQGGDDG